VEAEEPEIIVQRRLPLVATEGETQEEPELIGVGIQEVVVEPNHQAELKVPVALILEQEA
jgi:hypothetical protein